MIFFFYLLFNILFICDGIIWQAIHNLSIEFILMIFGTTFPLFMLYHYCCNGKLATDSYRAFGDCLFKSKWFILPRNLQKYFIFMISHAQRPLFYHGYGIVNLDLELFLKMIRTVVTYYMMFKTLTDA